MENLPKDAKPLRDTSHGLGAHFIKSIF
ncbi:MAG: hypothetical protein HW389_2630, partial [Bacteroidetes bacterium]|nr:hypothetical protein [Bacteroidota bacterium]